MGKEEVHGAGAQGEDARDRRLRKDRPDGSAVGSRLRVSGTFVLVFAIPILM